MRALIDVTSMTIVKEREILEYYTTNFGCEIEWIIHNADGAKDPKLATKSMGTLSFSD
jgi:hypothetical protein